MLRIGESCIVVAGEFKGVKGVVVDMRCETYHIRAKRPGRPTISVLQKDVIPDVDIDEFINLKERKR